MVALPPIERSTPEIHVHVPQPDPRETETRPEVERTNVSPGVEQKEFAPPNKKSSVDEQKTFAEPNKKRSVEPAQTIQPDDQNNSETIPNNSPPELFEPPQLADIPELEKIGPGRQRRYEELGKDDIESVREVVLFRHEFGKHWPGLSKDMEAYYEHFYFTKPKKGGKDYDRHVKCWERRNRWIAGSS